MAFTTTSAIKKVAKLKKRIRAVQGGTSASKTISILMYLIAKAQGDFVTLEDGKKKAMPTLTSIVSESFPHLKRGVMRDFLNIMQTQGYYDENRWNRTDFTYEFETGSKIEFFSADQPDKVRGPRRDRLFLNECNNLPLETFEQLEIRTKEFIFLDWNPTNEFWFYTDVLGKRDDVEHIILTYKDNEALDPRIVDAIEQRKGNKSWWRVYGEGLLGEVDGKIYRGWEVTERIPHEARLERYGVDFGYTNDPTAIVAVYFYNGGYILDEICYLKGQSNKNIADLLKNIDRAMIVADSAEPKSIDEIKSYGLNIVPAKKGRDSIRNGIQLVQQQKISITSSSINLIKEYRNYMWKYDKDGKPMQEPEGGNDHLLDALRYAMETLANRVLDDIEEDFGLYSTQYK
jgi:phage terminase large subunit